MGSSTPASWQVAHSGRTIGATAQFLEMMAAAGRDYDVLLVGYVSRFARDLRTAVNARHDLHPAGAALLFCDERVLSSDEEESWARETVEAEAYSRRLGRRVREGYEAKYRRLRDPGGYAPLGFRRTSERPRTLEVDPNSIEQATGLFADYAAGDVSIDELARGRDMNDRTVNDLLKNPIYNGWVQRKGDRSEARGAPRHRSTTICGLVSRSSCVPNARRRPAAGGSPGSASRAASLLMWFDHPGLWRDAWQAPTSPLRSAMSGRRDEEALGHADLASPDRSTGRRNPAR